jgi:acyl carrier protein
MLSQLPDVRRELDEIISQVFAVEPGTVRSDQPWAQLGADSFDLVEFVIAVQERFDVNLNSSDLTSLRTLDDLTQFLEARLSRS